MGTFQSVAKQKSASVRLPSNQPNATVNRAGGVAFEIADPSLKLITMAGGSFFAEPKFYDAESCQVTRATMSKLVTRLEITENTLRGVVSSSELNEVARELVATAINVGTSKNPEDLLVIANWLRNEMNIRLTPQVLLVLASRLDGTKSLVRKYAPKIIVRPDEVKMVWLIHRFFFGMKTMSNSLARGVTDAVAKFGERGLMKYDSPDFPKWFDILQVMHRRTKNYPLPEAVAKYFTTGKVIDPAATPIIAARKELATCSEFDAKAKELAKKSFVNWEVLVSQFGSSKKVWEFLIDENLIRYMAMLRNLRNILEARVSDEHIAKVSAFISNRDEVLRSKQLPFRFLAARKFLVQAENADMASMNELGTAVELASNYACENINLPGVTVIFADNSQSMRRNKVSDKSEMTCLDAANVLCGIVAKGAAKPYVLAFGTTPCEVHFTKLDTVLGIGDKVSKADTKGCATNGHKCVEWLIHSGLKPDRVIFLSDMQMWNDGSDDEQHLCVADTWPKYLASGSGTSKTWLHCVHMNGYGDSVVDKGTHVNQVGGFSEKVFNLIQIAEGIGGEALPTVDQIRKGWTVK